MHSVSFIHNSLPRKVVEQTLWIQKQFMVEKGLTLNFSPSHLDRDSYELITITYVHLRYIVLVLGSAPILNYQSLNTISEKKKRKKSRNKTRTFK
jgi:hypothetical protein